MSVGVTFWMLGRLWTRADVSGAERRALPVWMRLLLPFSRGLGSWLIQALSPAWVEAEARRIARCDFDVVLTIEDWIGLRLAVALGALLPLPALHRLSPDAILGLSLLLGLAGWMATAIWLRRWTSRRERLVLKELPVYLDIVTLCVESGATLTTALRVAVDKSPRSPLRQVLERVLREIRIGRSRVEALAYVARLYEIESLSALAAALVQSEGAGMSLGGVLRAQSEQRATERQLRAERCAMQAPVKMLGPLVLCVFPCTFIVIAVPVVVRVFLEAGG